MRACRAGAKTQRTITTGRAVISPSPEVVGGLVRIRKKHPMLGFGVSPTTMYVHFTRVPQPRPRVLISRWKLKLTAFQRSSGEVDAVWVPCGCLEVGSGVSTSQTLPSTQLAPARSRNPSVPLALGRYLTLEIQVCNVAGCRGSVPSSLCQLIQ
jgi:hypothetical protein